MTKILAQSDSPATEPNGRTFDPWWEEIDGPMGQPMNGRLPDEEVIQGSRELLESLGNTSTEETALPVDDGTGAVIVFCATAEGEPAVIVMVDQDLPSSLRVDLWGFCGDLAMSKESLVEENGGGALRVLTTRHPLTGRGSALLGALMIRRLGANTVGCTFDVEPLDLGEDQ